MNEGIEGDFRHNPRQWPSIGAELDTPGLEISNKSVLIWLKEDNDRRKRKILMFFIRSSCTVGNKDENPDGAHSVVWFSSPQMRTSFHIRQTGHILPMQCSTSQTLSHSFHRTHCVHVLVSVSWILYLGYNNEWCLGECSAPLNPSRVISYIKPSDLQVI